MNLVEHTTSINLQDHHFITPLVYNSLKDTVYVLNNLEIKWKKICYIMAEVMKSVISSHKMLNETLNQKLKVRAPCMQNNSFQIWIHARKSCIKRP